MSTFHSTLCRTATYRELSRKDVPTRKMCPSLESKSVQDSARKPHQFVVPGALSHSLHSLLDKSAALPLTRAPAHKTKHATTVRSSLACFPSRQDQNDVHSLVSSVVFEEALHCRAHNEAAILPTHILFAVMIPPDPKLAPPCSKSD